MSIPSPNRLRRTWTTLSSRRRLLVTLKRFGKNDQVILSVMALLLGAGAGGLAILFRLAIDGVQILALGFPGEHLVTLIRDEPWWRMLLAPTVGGLLIGVCVHRFMPGRRPQGVAQVIQASALRGGRMDLGIGIKAACLSAASIGVGASVGREGPVVHLGATVGSYLATVLHLGRALTRTLLGCGVAAGVAASFNAPIAGVFFALEVVVGHYALSAFAPVVIASVTGTIVSRMYYGDYPAFILPETYAVASFWEFPAFALLGVVCAAAAILFIFTVGAVEGAFDRARLPYWARPCVAGLLVGTLAAVGFPHLLGVGYEATDLALSELYPLDMLIALGALKIAATAVCIAAGFGGGVFSPALFIGAMTGGAFGLIATDAFPHLSSGHGAYTLVGMGAVAGSVLGAPISTILMIFELTSDYALTIAVMVSTVIASVITQQLHGRSFFLWQLERQGISLSGGQEARLLRAIRVRQLVDRTYDTVRPDTPVAEVRALLVKASWGELFVTEPLPESAGAANRAEATRSAQHDDPGSANGANDPPAEHLIGTITFHDLSEAAFDTSQDNRLTAADLMRAAPIVLELDDDLERAVKVFGASGEVHLPVVNDRRNFRLQGVAHEHELMATYHRALTQARREERGES
ncbi:chloride channel protein [Rhodovibrio salinarum]|uniref:Chloride channel protein n=1 Tax=Rhodovibrio salinarum TaxID=1087 RepID=A0A934QGF0_9PROT|nr:chloride channel protein [Rhodovibrio salinarum]MBK1696324.1 chloride channel protein [Rhodovibrio salinarum]